MSTYVNDEWCASLKPKVWNLSGSWRVRTFTPVAGGRECLFESNPRNVGKRSTRCHDFDVLCVFFGRWVFGCNDWKWLKYAGMIWTGKNTYSLGHAMKKHDVLLHLQLIFRRSEVWNDFLLPRFTLFLPVTEFTRNNWGHALWCSTSR